MAKLTGTMPHAPVLTRRNVTGNADLVEAILDGHNGEVFGHLHVVLSQRLGGQLVIARRVLVLRQATWRVREGKTKKDITRGHERKARAHRTRT